MGYYDAWLSVNENIQSTEMQDAYRMQEIAFGHASYLATTLWNSVHHVVQEQDLVGSVAEVYRRAQAFVKYKINGKWQGTSEEIKANDWLRVSVTYSNNE